MENHDAGRIHLSYEDAWALGYEDVSLVMQIVKTDDESVEQDELRIQHDLATGRIEELDVVLLRAYVDGMRGWLWENLW